MIKRSCPTPTKTRYTDEIKAKIHLSNISRYGESRRSAPVRAYECPCGAWHLTSMPSAPDL